MLKPRQELNQTMKTIIILSLTLFCVVQSSIITKWGDEGAGIVPWYIFIYKASDPGHPTEEIFTFPEVNQ